jgi:hypothetical protein
MRLARIYTALADYPLATLTARRALTLLKEAMGSGSGETMLRFEQASALELLGHLADRQGDRPQAERLLREAVTINEEIYRESRFEIGPLSNLVRLFLRLHKLTTTTSAAVGHGAPAPALRGSADLGQAERAAENLRRLQERGAKLTDEDSRLVERVLKLRPAESVVAVQGAEGDP